MNKRRIGAWRSRSSKSQVLVSQFSAAAILATGCIGSSAAPCPALTYRDTSISGPIPELTSLESDRGVAQAVSGATDHPFQEDELCIHRAEGLTELISISGYAPGLGCVPLGLIFQRHYYANIRDAAAQVLPALGWQGVTESVRGQIALAWVTEVLIPHRNVLTHAPPDFPFEFAAPSLAPPDEGGIVVRLWSAKQSQSAASPGEPSDTQGASAQSDRHDYQLREYRFDTAGALVSSVILRCSNGGG